MEVSWTSTGSDLQEGGGLLEVTLCIRFALKTGLLLVAAVLHLVGSPCIDQSKIKRPFGVLCGTHL